MADALVRLKIESQEYDAKIKRAQEGLIRYADECRKCGGTLEYVEKETLEYVKSLGNMETVSKTAKGKVAELSNAFTELSVQYKQLTDAEKNSPYGQALQGSLGQLKGRITELKGNLSDAAGEIAGPNGFGKIAESIHLPKEALGQLGQAFGSLGPVASGAMAALPKIMSPVGAAIAAIVLAVKELIGAFKRNEDAMTAVQKIAAPFKAVWQSIQRLFDDIVRIFVDVYSHLENVAGGFDGFKKILSPVAAAIATVRAALAVVGTVLTDLAKGVEFVSGKVRGAMQGSTVGKFFQGITDTVQGFFTKFTGWVDKIANSALGKKLGLDTLATQLKSIINTQDELTTSNKKIADSENELNKLRRQNIVQNAKDQRDIAKLREEAAKKDQYSHQERIKMLEQASALENKVMQRNVDERQKELDIIRLKNSLTQSGTQDLEAEAQAEAAVIQAETEAYKKKRELAAQIAEAKKADSTEKAKAAKVETKVETEPVEVPVELKITEGSLNDLRAQLKEAQDVLNNTVIGSDEWAAALENVRNLEGQIAEAQGKVHTATEETVQKVEKVPTTLEAMGTVTGSLGNVISGMDAIKNAGETLQEAFSGDMDAWDAMMAVMETGIGTMQTVMSVIQSINALKELSTMLSQKNAAASMAEGTAAMTGGMQEVAATTAATTASATKTGVEAGEAAAGAGKAMAGIPFVGPILAVAAIAAVLAAIMSATSKAKSAGKYATGGIIPGSSFSGDQLTANVNSGELILNRAQQANIAGQLQQNSVVGNGNLSTKIKGGDILIALDNTNRSRGGSRGMYARTK